MKQLRHLYIRPLDPIISRDGRPFDKTAGIIAYSMDDLSPSMIAGTIRTMIGKQLAEQRGISLQEIFNDPSYEGLKKLVVRGPIYKLEEKLLYPLPQDMYIYESDTQVHGSVVPRMPGLTNEGGFLGVGSRGLHADELWPPNVPEYSKERTNKPAYISETWMNRWLAELPTVELCEEISMELATYQTQQQNLGSQRCDLDRSFLPAFVKDERHHNEVDTSKGISKDQRLFTTTGLCIPHNVDVQAVVEWDEQQLPWMQVSSGIHSMGGKRRLAHIQNKSEASWPQCPPEVSHALAKHRKYVRMILVTPAFFTKGWKPGWLNEHLDTSNQKDKNHWTSHITLKLRWANIVGWQPFSGWSYKSDDNMKGTRNAVLGEKSVRRMVPAGSVYFFEVLAGDPSELARAMWLQSVSDDNRRKEAHDKDDGFGLAVWGVWDPASIKHK